MDKFFTFLKKGILAMMIVVFTSIVTYTPHPLNNIEPAEAVWATMGQQLYDNVVQGFQLVKQTLSAGYDYISSWVSNQSWIKDFKLDGIAWMIAKRIISAMVDSLVTWINSGFKGSPAFVQDLQGFLLDVGDQVVGDYIQELGAVGSFICSPFRLDVQVAVSQQYQLSRVDQYASDCTLSGALSNIKSFTSGAPGSFSQNGGWDNWFDITSSPEKYTPYGSYLSAQAGANARLVNAKGEEMSFLNFGGGFLSGEYCSQIQGPNGNVEDCIISKPGKIIQEALTFNLDSGRQSLVAADEVDEVLGALLGQIANKAFTGAMGLLDLGGYTSADYSASASQYNRTSIAGFSSSTAGFTNMQNSLAVEQTTLLIATNYSTQLTTYAASTTISTTAVAAAISAVATSTTLRNKAQTNITVLTGLMAEFSAAGTTETRKIQLSNTYNTMSLHTELGVNTLVSEWDTILKP